jgi:hypothetical protein
VRATSLIATVKQVRQKADTPKTTVHQLTTIPMEEFALGWRFTSPRHRALLPAHLRHVKPLDSSSAKHLRDLISHWYPLPSSGHARLANIASTRIDAYEPDDVRRIRKWLYERALPFKQEVFVLWDSHTAAITTWKMVVRYWDRFWYPSSDDVVVFDASLSWLLFLSHEEEAFFATG